MTLLQRKQRYSLSCCLLETLTVLQWPLSPYLTMTLSRVKVRMLDTSRPQVGPPISITFVIQSMYFVGDETPSGIIIIVVVTIVLAVLLYHLQSPFMKILITLTILLSLIIRQTQCLQGLRFHCNHSHIPTQTKPTVHLPGNRELSNKRT